MTHIVIYLLFRLTEQQQGVNPENSYDEIADRMTPHSIPSEYLHMPGNDPNKIIYTDASSRSLPGTSTQETTDNVYSPDPNENEDVSGYTIMQGLNGQLEGLQPSAPTSNPVETHYETPVCHGSIQPTNTA